MKRILLIETSATQCSVAIGEDGTPMWNKVCDEPQSHARVLSPYIQEAITHAKSLTSNNHPFDAVAVSCGPGSYTGLRIGVSTAKGLCVGWNIPLIAVETLPLLAHQFAQKHADLVTDNALLCPMIDARRMEVYTAIYQFKGNVLTTIREPWAQVVEGHTFADLLDNQVIHFFGAGADKCKNVLTSPNARFVDDIVPNASGMAPLAHQLLTDNKTQDVAYFEPYYLKDFVATTPKHKVI